MDGGPFKLPTKENADAARKKKVRRVPNASTSRVIERPTNAFPYRQPTAISPRHPTSLTAQEAIATVKKWVESHIPTKHIKDRTCVVDVSEVRAQIPSFTPHSCARPIDGLRSILLPVHVRERTLRRLQSNHTRATH